MEHVVFFDRLKSNRYLPAFFVFFLLGALHVPLALVIDETRAQVFSIAIAASVLHHYAT